MKKILRTIIRVLFVSILLFGIFYLIYFIENFSYVVYNSQLDKVCIDYGYEKATDSIFVKPRDDWTNKRHILIECDNKMITNKNTDLRRDNNWFELNQIGSSWCSSYDKWGDCKYHDSNKSIVIIH